MRRFDGRLVAMVRLLAPGRVGFRPPAPSTRTGLVRPATADGKPSASSVRRAVSNRTAEIDGSATSRSPPAGEAASRVHGSRKVRARKSLRRPALLRAGPWPLRSLTGCVRPGRRSTVTIDAIREWPRPSSAPPPGWRTEPRPPIPLPGPRAPRSVPSSPAPTTIAVQPHANRERTTRLVQLLGWTPGSPRPAAPAPEDTGAPGRRSCRAARASLSLGTPWVRSAHSAGPVKLQGRALPVTLKGSAVKSCTAPTGDNAESGRGEDPPRLGLFALSGVPGFAGHERTRSRCRGCDRRRRPSRHVSKKHREDLNDASRAGGHAFALGGPGCARPDARRPRAKSKSLPLRPFEPTEIRAPRFRRSRTPAAEEPSVFPRRPAST